MADTRRFGGGAPKGRTNPTSAPPPSRGRPATHQPVARSRPATGAPVPQAATTLTPDDARKTVMMQAADTSSPMAAVQKPPQVDVVRHDLPEDSPPDPRLTLVSAPDSQQAAAYRVLRHHLLERGRPQVIAVSSPKDGDGATTLAVNLALALGECNRAQVLLVDGNLRNPQVATAFRFVPPWCFAEQLTAHREQPLLPWGVVDIPAQTIHVAAVNPRREAGSLLDAPAFAIAMERLRMADYDHIVIDCPSVLSGADTNLIQDAADGVILATRRKRTRARDLRRAVEQLSPAKILGLTLIE